MKRIAALASFVAVAVAGCATSGEPGEVAARECGYFARVEGARVIGVEGVDAVYEGDAKLQGPGLQLEDECRAGPRLPVSTHRR